VALPAWLAATTHDPAATPVTALPLTVQIDVVVDVKVTASPELAVALSVESFNLIPNAELAVIPDAGHFTLSSEPMKVIPVVKHFLEKPEKRIPVATARTGYHPGKTR